MKNIIVAQSGGPTAAINASLAGVIRGAAKSQVYDKIYGAVYGITGVMDDHLVDLTEKFQPDSAEWARLYASPSSYLGSCRFRMPDAADQPEVYQQIFATLEKYNVGAFFYIGGNDSMDTIDKLAKYGKSIGSEIRFGGVPKTIDNDLVHIDHTPGYGSAAKYIAATMLEVAHDTYVYRQPCVTIVEIMGRNAGWLTAAAALARTAYSKAPQLIYLPEVAFSGEKFLADIRKLLETEHNIVVAVSEGIRDAEGNYITASDAVNDLFAHAQLSGVGKTLEQLVKKELGVKCRSVELSILQRCAAHISSETDLRESAELGEAAVRYTEAGNTGFMSSLLRTADEPYTYELKMAELSEIANMEKSIPREWINSEGNDVTEALLRYMCPLIEGEAAVSYTAGLPDYEPINHLTGE